MNTFAIQILATGSDNCDDRRHEEARRVGAVPRPRARTLAPVAHYPTAVVHTTDGLVTVGIEFGPDERFANEIPATDEHQLEVVVDVIAGLADLARRHDTRVLVAIEDARIVPVVRRIVAGCADLPVDLAQRSTWQVIRLFADLADARSREPEPVFLPRLVVGTDGSSDRRRGTWAWVSNEGKHDTGCSRSSLIDVCELEAIARAASAAGKRDLLVLTDSRAALRELRNGGTTRNKVNLVADVRRLVAERQAAGHTTEIAWVRGHAGVGLNEIADRLAVYARRVVAFGISHEAAKRAIDGILADLAEGGVPGLDARWIVSDQELAGHGPLARAC